ncbi:unnamed protein product [Linum tenue]|uniref:Uncharacterized protein n=1 Tax=Linum tenue TaxID=586396 RepID=A0AAV0KS89_9ROSI|nr:unnamed protein product [Linum tenue]
MVVSQLLRSIVSEFGSKENGHVHTFLPYCCLYTLPTPSPHLDVGAASRVSLLEADEVRQEAARAVAGLFSQELPPPGRCPFGGGTSGLATDLKMEFADCRRGVDSC